MTLPASSARAEAMSRNSGSKAKPNFSKRIVSSFPHLPGAMPTLAWACGTKDNLAVTTDHRKVRKRLHVDRDVQFLTFTYLYCAGHAHASVDMAPGLRDSCQYLQKVPNDVGKPF